MAWYHQLKFERYRRSQQVKINSRTNRLQPQ